MKYFILVLSILTVFFISSNAYGLSIPLTDSSTYQPTLCKIAVGSNLITCHKLADKITLVGGTNMGISMNNATNTITFTSTSGNAPNTMYCSPNYQLHSFNQTTLSFICAKDNGTSNIGAFNIGTGQGSIFAGMFNGTFFNFKTIKAGTNITIQNNTNDITITANSGSGNTFDVISNIGTGEASFYAGNTTNTHFTFKTAKQGTGITIQNNTNDVTISTSFRSDNISCGAGHFVQSYNNSTGVYTCALDNSGTVTDGANIGDGGFGFFKNSTNGIINLRNLTTTRTDLFTISQSSNDVNLASLFKSKNITCSAGNAVTSFNNSTGTYTCSPFGSGTITTASNIGHGGEGVFAQVSGSNIQLKNITSVNSNAVITQNATDVLINVATQSDIDNYLASLNGDTTSAQTVNAGVGITVSNSGATHTVKTNFINGTGIVITGTTSQTIATNFKFDSVTCGAGKAIVILDNSTISSCASFLTTAVTSINGDTTAAQKIAVTSPITITESGATHTINCPTCLTAAITSINGDTTGAQKIVATSPVTVTQSGATNTIACATCITAAVVSINGDTHSAQNIAGTSPVTVTQSGATATVACATCLTALPATHFLVDKFDTERVLTNIGTSFVDVAVATANANGHAISIDTHGFTKYKYQVIWTKAAGDGGTETCQLVDIATGTNIMTTTASLVSGMNTGSDTSIPAGLLNSIHDYKWQCKSTTATDDPSFLASRLWLFP